MLDEESSALRRDARDNRRRLLDAATVAVHREGPSVPMATVAAEAGVGIGTLYRHFPSREALLDALTHRSFQQVLRNAAAADASATNGLEAVSLFLDATIRDRRALVLPLHGGGAVTTVRTRTISRQVQAAVRRLIARGQSDGSIRDDVSASDVIVFGAMLAQPNPITPDWSAVSSRLQRIYLRGLQP